MTQNDALDILKLGYNVYLTGSAGSGKTFVLNTYLDYLKKEGIVAGITASTGVAATQINGITVNSWSGIGIKRELTESDIADLLKRPYLRKRFSKTKVLVIDEVSMLQDYMLDMLNTLSKAFKNNPEPFGGLQLILCGDFFQLPPVMRDAEITVASTSLSQKTFFPERNGVESKGFIYKSKAWRELDLKICYLEQEYRQSDKEFLHVLHEIRQNSITKPSIKMLAARMYKPLGPVSTRLYTHNVNVDEINKRELAKLPGHIKTFTMTSKGTESMVNIMKKSCLAPEVLELKKGALVMFVKNNFEKKFVNGTLGTVSDFAENGNPVIKTAAGDDIIATPSEWTIEEDGEIKAQIKQLPLRLAWAITIHKSQGMSLDAAEIDLRKPFAAGMGYVALSRVKTLDGIRLLGLNHKALLVNEEVLSLDKNLQARSAKTARELSEMNWIEVQVMQQLFVHELQD
jgi:ATP-dependent DNA helicase PIF1